MTLRYGRSTDSCSSAIPPRGGPAGVGRSAAMTVTPPPVEGIRKVTQRRLLDEINAIKLHGVSGSVMIVDKLGRRVLSAVCRLSEVLDAGITSFEPIEDDRASYPDFGAIYFIAPSVASINAMLDDFKDPRNPKYGQAHVLLTSHLPDALMAKIKASPILNRVGTLMEVNVEFIAMEAHVFSVDTPDSLTSIFRPRSLNVDNELHTIADRLCTVFATYKEFPYIRYMAKGHPSTQSLAYIIQEKLEKLGRATGCFSGSRTSDRPTLLVLDRTVDCVAPVIHEYSYQAMINDLLPVVDGERYTYKYESNAGQELDKEVLLNETDPLWPTLRHMHIAECVEFLHSSFKDFLLANESAVRLNRRQEGTNMRELANALRSMPQFQKQMSLYSQHISITEQLMKRFNENKLESISTLEQNMAVGEDIEGACGPPLPGKVFQRAARQPAARSRTRLRRPRGEGPAPCRGAHRQAPPGRAARGQGTAPHDLHRQPGGHQGRGPATALGGRSSPAPGRDGHHQSLLPRHHAVPGLWKGDEPPQTAFPGKGPGRRGELRPVPLHPGRQEGHGGRAYRRGPTRRLPLRQGQACRPPRRGRWHGPGGCGLGDGISQGSSGASEPKLGVSRQIQGGENLAHRAPPRRLRRRRRHPLGAQMRIRAGEGAWAPSPTGPGKRPLICATCPVVEPRLQTHQRDILIGSTCMLTPQKFVGDVKALKTLDTFGEAP